MDSILVIDCNWNTLQDTYKMICEVVSGVHVSTFMEQNLAMKFIEKHPVGTVFIDLIHSGIQGILFAKEILKVKTEINIIFIASSDEYSSYALEMHASGYIKSPVTLLKIKEELMNRRFQSMSEN